MRYGHRMGNTAMPEPTAVRSPYNTSNSPTEKSSSIVPRVSIHRNGTLAIAFREDRLLKRADAVMPILPR